jgi:hypothetical protein
MGEPTDHFDELAHALVQALDAWAEEVAKVTDGDKSPSRAGLIKLLEGDATAQLERHGQPRKKIDAPLLTYWLKGRNQLLPGSKKNRLPSEEDGAAISRVLKEKAPRCAEQLPKISAEIAVLSSRLGREDPRWRDKVLSRLTHETASAEAIELSQEAQAADHVPASDDQADRQAATPATSQQQASAETTSQTRGKKQVGKKAEWLVGTTVGVAIVGVALGVLGLKANTDDSAKTPDASAPRFAGAPHCRQTIPVDESGTHHAKINPCISIDSNNQVHIWSEYTAEETGTFTVFIWLADATNADPVTSIYARCPVTFTHIGQPQTAPCRKSGITPPRRGKWIASMVVEPGTPQTPTLWNTNYKGTQSGGVTWNG